ncbi:ATP-dependent Clp protease proteolytic subunit, partial [uncultured Abyssibacter sp.]|uniref:ATP-dependent Clp protease proteolytic subunit n=1 Tax=uncultured Abyssibacter sp. TaxID=2320202 RepID=UPI0032B27FB1
MDDLRLESEPDTSVLNDVFKLEGKLLFDARFVLVFGGINDKTAAIICRQLLAMDHDKVAPIRMLISSPGGHVESGDAIHDMIRFIRSPVT